MAANNGNAHQRAARALDRILNKPRPAILGWQKSDTEVIIDAPGGLGRVYITWQGGRDTAVNTRGVPLAPLLPILVVPGEPNEIVGIDFTHPDAVTAALNNEYGTPAHPLSAHSDVLLTTLSNDEVLAWDATAGKWVNVAQAGALVTSVNSQTGAVVLDADDIDDSATTNKFATAAELADIASAVQPGDLATVATTGAYSDLSGTPTIPAETGAAINAAAADTPLDADKWGFWDVVDGVLKSITHVNLKALLKTYFDTLYGLLGSTNTWTQVNTFSSRVDTPIVRADSAAGINILDDGGNPGLFVADGGNVMVGPGTPGAKLDINGSFRAIGTSTPPSASGVGQAIELWYWTGSGGPYALLLSFDRDAGTYKPLRIAGDSIGFEIGATRGMTLTSVGLGIGVVAPQGRMHIHDGTSGHLVVTKTGVNATTQVIIPDATGDVISGVRIEYILVTSAGQIVTAVVFLWQGGTMVVNIAPSTTTWTITLNANGQLSVARTAGTATATFKFVLDWI